MGIETKRDPNADQFISNIQNSPNNMGNAHMYHKLIRGILTGKSDVGADSFLAPIAQAYGTEADAASQDVEDDPSTADQPWLKNRNKILAKSSVLQGEGGALAQGRGQELNMFQNAYQGQNEDYLNRELQKNLGANAANDQDTHYFQTTPLWQSLLGAGVQGGVSKI